MTPTLEDWELVAELMGWRLVEALHPEKNSVHVCVVSRDGYALHYCGGHKLLNPLGDYRDMHAIVEAAMGEGYTYSLSHAPGKRACATFIKDAQMFQSQDDDPRIATYSAIVAAKRAERDATCDT